MRPSRVPPRAGSERAAAQGAATAQGIQTTQPEGIVNSNKRMGRFLASFAVVLALAACAATPQRESTGEFIDDSVLTTKVKAVLLHDPAVSGLAVNVETFKGVVQLSGFVKSAAERDKAAELARAVPGVKQVKNDLLLR